MGKTSRTAFVVCALLVFSGSVRGAGPDKSEEAAALLANARKLENLQTEPAAPFLLRAKLAASLPSGKVSGEYVMGWRQPDHWREVLVLADFRRVREGAADGYNQVRSLDFQPQIIFDIDEALDVDSLLRLSPDEKINKIDKRKVKGVELSCVSVYLKDYPTRQLCFDSAGLLTYVENQAYGTSKSAHHTIEYSSFLSLGAHKFPSSVKLSVKGGYWIEISVTQFEPFAAPPDLTLSGDPHSEFWRSCRESAPAKIVKQIPPIYPSASKLNHEQGVVTVYARVEADGTTSHVKPLASPFQALEQATIAAVADWKYQPKTCGGAPVRTEIIIEVTYTLSG